MENLRVESAAHVLVSRALPNGLAVYRLLLERQPTHQPLDDGAAAAVGGAVLLYGLYCRLLELEGGPDPEEAMERAFGRLGSEPAYDAALLAAIRERYQSMLTYNVFRPNGTVLEFIRERARHAAYPEHEISEDGPSAFTGFVQYLVEESYGKLQAWNLV